ncbi:MAG TPA: hypothetical protein PLN21_12490 [Gemmatales bacterium]|nr:hypothetical protein [Gemmatales bacterium]
MKRTLMTLAVVAALSLLYVSDILAQRGGRGGGGYRGGYGGGGYRGGFGGGYGGGQPRLGTGYGGTARTGEGDGLRTGYGGGFGGEQPRLGTGYGGTARTGEGDGPRTGYGNGRGGLEQPRLGTGYGGTARTGEGDGFRTGYGAGGWDGRAGAGYGLGQAGVGYAGVGTYHQMPTALYAQAGAVRNGFGYYGAFAPNWYGRYPNAWYATGWGAAAAWNYPTWPALAAYTSYPDTLNYYDYGTSVVYQNNDVYINGDNVGTQEAYAQQAATIAEAGRAAKVSQDGNWMSLGVFGMLKTDQQQNATDVFQLAINKDGVIRGTYYNAGSDSTQTVYGCVGTKSERAAWTTGDNKTPVYEAGIANLTKPETTMLVHFGKGNTAQYTLVRMDKPKE